MPNSAQPLMDQLGESLKYFEERANAFPAELRRKKPDSVAFSATEIVYHMLDVELLWQSRFAKLLDNGEREFQAMNPDVVAKVNKYNEQNYDGGLSSLREARMATLSTVESFTEDELNTTAIHPKYGEISILRMLEIMTGHDRQHAGQLDRTLAKLGEIPTQ
jgi:uncharacterized damage-inducible protein DinB